MDFFSSSARRILESGVSFRGGGVSRPQSGCWPGCRRAWGAAALRFVRCFRCPSGLPAPCLRPHAVYTARHAELAGGPEQLAARRVTPPKQAPANGESWPDRAFSEVFLLQDLILLVACGVGGWRVSCQEVL